MALITLASKAGAPVQAHTRILAPPPGWEVRSPGIVFLHDWWGHDDAIADHVERISDILRTFAVAPDYYDGKRVEEPNPYWGDLPGAVAEAAAAAQTLDLDRACDAVEASIGWIKSQRAAHPNKTEYTRYNGKIALVGFGLGAGLALAAASRLADPDVRAVVGFYGLPREGWFRRDTFRARAQFHLVAGDEWAPPSQLETLKATLGERAASIELHTWAHNCEEGKEDDRFPARRGFAEHQPLVAARAWRKALPFLREALDVAPDGTPLDEYRLRVEDGKRQYPNFYPSERT